MAKGAYYMYIHTSACGRSPTCHSLVYTRLLFQEKDLQCTMHMYLRVLLCHLYLHIYYVYTVYIVNDDDLFNLYLHTCV